MKFAEAHCESSWAAQWGRLGQSPSGQSGQGGQGGEEGPTPPISHRIIPLTTVNTNYQ